MSNKDFLSPGEQTLWELQVNGLSPADDFRLFRAYDKFTQKWAKIENRNHNYVSLGLSPAEAVDPLNIFQRKQLLAPLLGTCIALALMFTPQAAAPEGLPPYTSSAPAEHEPPVSEEDE